MHSLSTIIIIFIYVLFTWLGKHFYHSLYRSQYLLLNYHFIIKIQVLTYHPIDLRCTSCRTAHLFGTQAAGLTDPSG